MSLEDFERWTKLESSSNNSDDPILKSGKGETGVDSEQLNPETQSKECEEPCPEPKGNGESDTEETSNKLEKQVIYDFHNSMPSTSRQESENPTKLNESVLLSKVWSKGYCYHVQEVLISLSE